MEDRRPRTIAFPAVVLLFLAWGFINANNDPLIAALLHVFGLSFTQGISVQLVSFLAFATMSLPLAALLARIGAVRTILTGLVAMATGCAIIGSAGWAPHFPVILAALFVLASGVVALQVAANPLAATLGPPERSHFRLTLAQSFNALGVVLGVHYGAWSMLGGPAGAAPNLAAISRAFLAIGAALVLLASLIVLARRQFAAEPLVGTAPPRGSRFEAWRSRWAVGGAGAIALYVGAEVSVGSMLVLYLATPQALGLTLAESGSYVANFYWGGALVGRFVGSWLLRHIAARRLLLVAAVAAASLCALSLILPGHFGGWCLLSIGLFNSIMFPTIFTLTLERSSASHAATSGLLCAAIGAGAVLPLLAGVLADRFGLGWSFAAALAGYLYVAAFAVALSRARTGIAETGVSGRADH